MTTPQQHPRRRFALALTFSLGLLAIGCSSGGASTNATTSSTTTAAVSSERPQVSSILDKQARTVLDQLLQYPSGSQAQVSSAVLTVAPGVSTGLHKHDAPLYVYVLEGTITVTYDGGIVKDYTAGSAILEAVGTAHNGENRTDTVVKLLVVNIGAEGVANTVTL
jgi:quercetin dioxygenase-like cupin family protein